MKSIDWKKTTDILLLWGLLAVTAFPFFCSNQIFITMLFVITGFFYLKRSVVFDPRALTVVIPFVIVETLQFLIVKPFDPIMITGTFIRMFLGMFVVQITGKNFFRYFIDINYFFAVVSFIFFIPCAASEGIYNFFVNNVCRFFVPPAGHTNSGFYDVEPTNILFCFHSCIPTEVRNPGPYWEPGIYSVFLNMSLMFNLLIEKKLWTKKNIVFLLALISTFSTAGYLGLFFLIFSYYIVNQTLGMKILFIITVLPILVALYFSLDFLSSKVDENINLAGSTTTSRFGSGLADINDFQKSPLIGWGRGVMRYGGKKFTFFSEDQHRNNGVTDLLATYGIFIFTFYFYNYYMGFRFLCKSLKFNVSFAIYALALIILLGFSQTIFLKPFFYSMLFLQFTFMKQPTRYFLE